MGIGVTLRLELHSILAVGTIALVLSVTYFFCEIEGKDGLGLLYLDL